MKKKKSTRRYHYFIPVYQKSWYDQQLLRYSVWPTEICNYGSFFALLTPKKSEFWKNEKSCWRYYHFTHVYLKRKSYEVWFLRYGATQTEFFVILDHFWPFYPPNNPYNQNFEKMKKGSGDAIIFHLCNKNPRLYDVCFQRYGVRQT